MRFLFVLSLGFTLATAAQARDMAEVRSLTNPKLNELVLKYEKVSTHEELGNCLRYTFKIKFQDRGEFSFQDMISDFMSRVAPDGLDYNFGLFRPVEISEDAGKSIKRLAPEAPSAALEADLAEAANGTVLALNEDSTLSFQSGLGQYMKVDQSKTKILGEGTVSFKLLLDSANEELLVLAAGTCETR